jgi:hypothetical protein
VLLPDSTGNSGVGARLAGIISQRWDWGTIHLNGEMALTREHHGDVFVGGIIEGPSQWAVRPVAEVFYENEFGKSETISGLIGLIWRVRDDLSFDVGLRHALTNGHPVNEIRAGLTPEALRYFRSLTWPLLSTTRDTSLPSFIALTEIPSAVDLMSRICV